MAKTIWITGAGQGIGRNLALRYAAQGATVAASSRTLEDLETLAAEAARLSGRILPFPLDISDSDAAGRVVGEIEDVLGPIDLAILNAGIYIPDDSAAFDLGAFNKGVDTNLKGTIGCYAVIADRMLRRRSGTIGLMASVAGYRGLPTSAAYSATKAALIAFGEAMKPGLERAGVDLRVICPGFVDTPATRKNKFPMPFLIDVETASKAIVAGLQSRKFEIVFPWRMAATMKLLRMLPNGLLFAITRRMLS